MRFAVIFTAAGLALVGLAAMASNAGARVLGIDFAGVCLLIGLAYALNRPGFLLKQPGGRTAAAGWLLYWPYFALSHAALRLFRVRIGSKAFQPIAGQVWLGCRLSSTDAAKIRELQVGSVLDLAAEFSEVSFLRALPGYRSVPILDTCAPTLEQLRAGADFIERAQLRHPVYVHCALGHGRSACFVLGWLLATRRTASVDAGLAELRRIRPGVGFDRKQRAALDAFAAELNRA